MWWLCALHVATGTPMACAAVPTVALFSFPELQDQHVASPSRHGRDVVAAVALEHQAIASAKAVSHGCAVAARGAELSALEVNAGRAQHHIHGEAAALVVVLGVGEAARVRCVSIFRDKNRHYIGKSQSKWPPKGTQRTPHPGAAKPSSRSSRAKRPSPLPGRATSAAVSSAKLLGCSSSRPQHARQAHTSTQPRTIGEHTRATASRHQASPPLRTRRGAAHTGGQAGRRVGAAHPTAHRPPAPAHRSSSRSTCCRTLSCST
jgi:hypothetical protein